MGIKSLGITETMTPLAAAPHGKRQCRRRLNGNCTCDSAFEAFDAATV